VLRHFASLAKARDSKSTLGGVAAVQAKVAVSDIMRRELLTVAPDTLTVDAIALMRRQRVGCLPVVQDGHIVALITEEDFMGIASELLDERIGQVDPPHEHPKSRRRP
jgi:CBS domain-containing protein